MGKLVLKNSRVWIDGTDLTGDIHALNLELGKDLPAATTMGSNGVREYESGLRFASFAHSCYFRDDGAADAALAGLLGSTTSQIVSISPDGAQEGGVIWTAPGWVASHQPFAGQIGELAKVELAGTTTGDLVRATLLNSADTTQTSDGNGSAQQVGAVASDELAVAVFHVLEISGTLTVTVDSDDASGMASPTTRFTFNAATSPGAQRLVLSGPVTDDWWRASWTLTGSAKFAVMIGIV
ncbi:MAG TPA: hypothetical protein ENK57_01185 [Polyangiaceae bacterium]|nr:hypothetical protein [Polyangiaceae bacterium]